MPPARHLFSCFLHLCGNMPCLFTISVSPQTALSRPAWSAGGHWTCGACFLRWELNGVVFAVVMGIFVFDTYWMFRGTVYVQKYFYSLQKLVRILQTCAFIFHCVLTRPCNRKKRLKVTNLFCFLTTALIELLWDILLKPVVHCTDAVHDRFLYKPVWVWSYRRKSFGFGKNCFEYIMKTI